MQQKNTNLNWKREKDADQKKKRTQAFSFCDDLEVNRDTGTPPHIATKDIAARTPTHLTHSCRGSTTEISPYSRFVSA